MNSHWEKGNRLMKFDFQCQVCPDIVTVKAVIGTIPRAPKHCGRKMRRIYAAMQFHVGYGVADYMNRAYEGAEAVPGYSRRETRQTLDTMV